MPITRNLLAAAMAAFLFVGAVEVSFAQSRKTDELVATNIEALTAWAGLLDGRVTDLEARLRIIAEEGAKNPNLMEIVGPLAKLISAREEGNQKQAFLDQLVELACRNIQDNCELRRRIEELERWRRERERHELEPAPTPAEQPPIVTVPPTPKPEYAPLPDNDQPKIPRIWVGPVHFITDQPAYVVPYARLVERCVNLDSADGIACHGDVYQDSYGRFILLKHTPRYQYRSVLAAR